MRLTDPSPGSRFALATLSHKGRGEALAFFGIFKNGRFGSAANGEKWLASSSGI